jgi:hypothetical protein
VVISLVVAASQIARCVAHKAQRSVALAGSTIVM